MPSPDDAEAAVSVIERRLETGASQVTGTPFAELLVDYDVQAVSDEPIVVIDLVTGDAPRHVLINMLYKRDLGFIAW